MPKLTGLEKDIILAFRKLTELQQKEILKTTTPKRKRRKHGKA